MEKWLVWGEAKCNIEKKKVNSDEQLVNGQSMEGEKTNSVLATIPKAIEAWFFQKFRGVT